MGQHDALGDARRPARVLVHGDVVEADLDGRWSGPVLLQAIQPAVDVDGGFDVAEGVFLEPTAEDALYRAEVVADAGPHDLFDLCPGPQIDHPVGQGVQADQDLCPGIVELVLQFDIGIEGVVHHGDAPDPKDGVIGRHAGNAVGQQERDGVPLLDAEIGQAGGEAVHHVLQGAEGDGRPLEDQGRVVRKLLRRPVQDRGQADVLILNELRHPFLVRLQPRFVQINALSRHCFQAPFFLMRI